MPSHELRTPATVLRSTAELGLARPRTRDEYVGILRTIHDEAEGMGTLVENLLLLAAADEGLLGTDKRRVFLDDVLVEAADRARVRAAERRVAIRMTAFEEAPVDGDPVLLKQLLLILLDNALRFTPPGGTVEASVSRRGDVAAACLIGAPGSARAPPPRVRARPPGRPCVEIPAAPGPTYCNFLERRTGLSWQVTPPSSLRPAFNVRPSRSGLSTLPRTAGIALFAGLSWGCGPDDGAEPPPAVVTHPVTEAELTTVRLTAAAAERIGIVVGAVEESDVRGRRILGGELVAPAGSSLTLTAPRAATVLPAAGGALPGAGDLVSRGQPLVRLAVLASDVARGGEDVAVAEARLENARAKAERALRLLDAGVASQAQAEDARAELRSAEAALDAARSRRAVQRGAAASDGASSVVVRAPRAGWVQSVHVAAGQTVADGAPLLELVAPDPLWVRVPVYVGDAAGVDRSAPVLVVEPGGEAAAGRDAFPVQGPRTADASAASVDLFYSLPNAEGRYRPGQRVGVVLPLTAEAREAVVPWSAVVHDIHGGTWIYEALGSHAYARRRVEVRDVQGDVAVLGRGPAPGTPVVIVGAAELFSTEFGTSH